MAPTASAAPAATSQSADPGPDCHTDPLNGSFYCDSFDVSSVAMPAVASVNTLTCVDQETGEFGVCKVGQAGAGYAPGGAAQ
ncbi:hypothetical protein OG897_30375 [Streptomyces sp. NBC_00237]|uniref:hypothetical protein n=1 Tax=Streptomyces sp. NBC_00237 TaxID=2975687 RepID=UPI00224D9102|nr:hypothetical protein [Streptomyces sp. NBC_00237]MCX5205746.1 hypothetical protein [Streptomyces sp. NBC_00237]